MPSPPRSSLLLTLGVLALSALAPAPALAQCRATCAANELLDANGCCVTSPGFRARGPDEDRARLERPRHGRWSQRIQAHHLSAQLEQADEARLLSEASQSSDRSGLYWTLFMSLEHRLLDGAAACAREEDIGRARECLRGLDPIQRARVTLLSEAIPHWVEQSEAEVEWRGRELYYAAIGELAVGLEERGLTRLDSILNLDASDPYVAWALASLGDHFFLRGDYTLAEPMYLKARQFTSSSVGIYATHMSGWCVASRGKTDQAMKLMLSAYDSGSRSERMHTRPLFVGAMRADITWVYAHVGSAEGARAFYTALGVPEPLLDRQLDKLIRAYEEVGRKPEAKALRGLQKR